MPCRAEAPELQVAWRKYQKQSVVFFEVNVQDREEDAKRFMEKFGITYLNWKDESGKAAIGYEVWGSPRLLLSIERAG